MKQTKTRLLCLLLAAAMLLLALAVIWALALVLAGPALLKFCILYLFG